MWKEVLALEKTAPYAVIEKKYVDFLAETKRIFGVREQKYRDIQLQVPFKKLDESTHYDVVLKILDERLRHVLEKTEK